MRSKALLAASAAAAIAVVLLVLWKARSDGSTDREAGQRSVADDVAAPGAGASPDRASRRQPPDAVASAEDGEAAVEGRDVVSSPGATVRDHRGQGPLDGGPLRRTPGKPPIVIQRPIIAVLRHGLRPEIRRCSQAHAGDIAGKARVQGSLTVTVKGGLLTVRGVEIQQTGVATDSALVECARKAFAAATVPAEGHDDVDSHTIRLPFELPMK